MKYAYLFILLLFFSESLLAKNDTTQKKLECKHSHVKTSSNLMHNMIDAINENDLDCVIFLLSSGFDVNQKDKYGNTALIYSAMSGLKNISKELIKNKAKKNIINSQGYSYYHYSISLDFLETILNDCTKSNLLKFRAFKGEYLIIPPDGQPPTSNAAANGGFDCMKMTYNIFGGIDDMDGRGATALIESAILNDSKKIEFLIKNGANKDIKNKYGYSYSDYIEIHKKMKSNYPHDS